MPPLFRGHPIAIVASGPSLTQEDCDYLRGRAKVIAINSSWPRVPWADMLYACDPSWWDRYEGVAAFAGMKVTQSAVAAERWGLTRVPGIDEDGISLDPYRIHFGEHSGFQALNLAVLLGDLPQDDPILLLGYDMKPGPGNVMHWHGNHPQGLNNPQGIDQMAGWMLHYLQAAPQLSAAGVRVIQCSRDTAMDFIFPCADLKEVL